jgi:exonuclease SbcC
LNIRTISLGNYRSYEEEFEMEFRDNEMILIYGKNGAGKSTIFDAMHWCLYGRGLDGKTNTSLINKNIKKDMFVKMEIELKDDVYEIERYYKHKNFNKDSTVVIIKKNGENIESTTVDSNNKMIENLLMPQDIFLSTVLFSQLSKHLLTSGTDKSRKEIFDIILNMEDLITKNEKVKSVISELKMDLTKLESGNEEEVIETLMQQKDDLGIHELELKLIQINNKLEKFENLPNLDEFEQKINSLKESLSNNQIILSQKESEYNQLYSEYQNEKTNLETEYNNNKENLEYKLNTKYNEKLSKERELLQNNNSQKQEEIQNSINNLYGQLQQKDSDISNIKDEINNIDNQISNLNNEYEQNIRDYRQNINYNTNLLNNKKQELQTKENEIQSLVESMGDPIVCPNCGFEIKDDNHMEKTINNMKESKIILIEEVNKLETQLNEISEPQKSEELINKETLLNQNKNELYKKIESINNEKQNMNNQILQYNEQINNIKSSINNKYQEIEQTINQEKTNEYNNLINDLNETFNKRLEKMESFYNEKGTELQNQYKKLKSDIDNMNGEIKLLTEQYNNLKEEYKNKEEISYNKKYIIEQLNKAKEKDKELTEKIDIQSKKLLDRKNKMEEISDDINVMEFWKEAFGNKGIKNMLLDDIIPYLNDRAFHYSNLITNGKFKLTFTSIKELKSGDFREEFDMVIFKEGFEDPFEYKELSGGQQRIIDLITMFALEDLMNHINEFDVNIALYDEVFSILDEDVRNSLTDVLNEKKAKKCIVIISHVQLPFDFDDRVLVESNG